MHSCEHYTGLRSSIHDILRLTIFGCVLSDCIYMAWDGAFGSVHKGKLDGVEMLPDVASKSFSDWL